jgi:hypothetical protein
MTEGGKGFSKVWSAVSNGVADRGTINIAVHAILETLAVLAQDV